MTRQLRYGVLLQLHESNSAIRLDSFYIIIATLLYYHWLPYDE